MPTVDARVDHGYCWDTSARPAPEFLRVLTSGPFSSVSGAALDELIAALRRETVARPVIYVGAGTCGLGAGADKTLEQIKAFCARTAMNVDVHEVGCVGLCSEEPVVDIQLPGRARVSFGNVTADKVDALLGQVFAGAIPSLSLIHI